MEPASGTGGSAATGSQAAASRKATPGSSSQRSTSPASITTPPPDPLRFHDLRFDQPPLNNNHVSKHWITWKSGKKFLVYEWRHGGTNPPTAETLYDVVDMNAEEPETDDIRQPTTIDQLGFDLLEQGDYKWKSRKVYHRPECAIMWSNGKWIRLDEGANAVGRLYPDGSFQVYEMLRPHLRPPNAPVSPTPSPSVPSQYGTPNITPSRTPAGSPPPPAYTPPGTPGRTPPPSTPGGTPPPGTPSGGPGSVPLP